MPLDSATARTRPDRQVEEKRALKILLLDLLENETADDLTATRMAVEKDAAVDAELDSIQTIGLILDVETALGIAIADDELTSSRLRSLEQFADFLIEKVRLARQVQ